MLTSQLHQSEGAHTVGPHLDIKEGVGSTDRDHRCSIVEESPRMLGSRQFLPHGWARTWVWMGTLIKGDSVNPTEDRKNILL